MSESHHALTKGLILFLVLLLGSNYPGGADAQDAQQEVSPGGMISVKRFVEPLLELEDDGGSRCSFIGKVVLAGPSSLEQGDRYFKIAKKQLTSMAIVVDYINKYRCGIRLSSGNYAIELQTYDDQSSKDWTRSIAEKIAPRTSSSADINVLLGGYSTGITEPLAEVADSNGRLLLAPGAATTSVFAGRDSVFGTFPPTAQYAVQAIQGLAEAGAKSIATVWELEKFTQGVCGAVPALADAHGLKFTSSEPVSSSPDIETLVSVAERLAVEDPDIVVTCVYDTGCANWMHAMREAGWSPKAQIFTVCVGLDEFTKEVGSDSEYVMGVVPWDSSLKVRDDVTGWSAEEFAARFRAETSEEDVTYHAASAASVISIIVQAMEQADTTDETQLAQGIAQRNLFETMYGHVSFDENGQNRAPSLLIQYDTNGTVQTVFPAETSSGPILYPMPSWNRRDCIRMSECETQGDTCAENGQCVCTDPYHTYTVGAGETARCIPKEDMNYIHPAMVAVGCVFVAFVLLVALGALGWIYYHRTNTLVKVSQPFFLVMVISGAVISTLAVIPMSIETGYRATSDDIRSVDAACMAVPWLWGIGFSITFSALFAKVWRVKKIYDHNNTISSRRKRVEVKDVFSSMFYVIAVEVAILLSFQLVSPHRWEREVIDAIDGYSVSSVGHCTSDSGWWFFAGLVGFNVLCLFYALVLCFQTKDIPSRFSENTQIFLSVMFWFQVLVLVIPIFVMVRDSADVFYFVRAGTIFLQNFTVLIIIFEPKMRRVYRGEDTQASMRSSADTSAGLVRTQVRGGSNGVDAAQKRNDPLYLTGLDSEQSRSTKLRWKISEKNARPRSMMLKSDDEVPSEDSEERTDSTHEEHSNEYPHKRGSLRTTRFEVDVGEHTSGQYHGRPDTNSPDSLISPAGSHQKDSISRVARVSMAGQVVEAAANTIS